MKILVTDDDPTARRQLRTRLSLEGHQVIECEDGMAALLWLEKNSCDAVVSDVLMPRMDGFRLCYELRESGNFKNIPVILYTACQLSATDEKAAMAMGADRFVRNPALPDQILEALNRSFEPPPAKQAKKAADLSALREYSDVLVKKLEETNIELSLANAALEENRRRLSAIIESEPECVKILARDGTLLEMNPAGLRMIEAQSPAQVIGEPIDALVVPEHRRSFQELTEATFRGESRSLDFEIIGLNGTRRWLNTHSAPLCNSNGEIVAALAITREITAKKHNEALLNGQMRVLEMIAQGAPLQATLDALLRVIEAQSDDMLCSILLLDAAGRRLKCCAAPSLPARYRQAIDGAAIGENAGSCGAAIYRSEPVVAEDIATDPLWEDLRQVALAHDLRACWSTPVFDAQHQVLGSFAIYCRTPSRPTEQHQRLIDIATHIVAIAISKQREETALRESEARFREMADSAPVMIWMSGRDGSCSYVNRQWIDFTGQNYEVALGSGWLDAIHPDDRDSLHCKFIGAIERRTALRFEYRLRRRDGEYRWIIDSALPRVNERGEFLGYIGSVFDISERKQADDERQRNLDRVRTLHEINLAITSTMNRQSQLAMLLEKIEKFFAYPIVSSIRLFRQDTGRLESLANRGVEGDAWYKREPERTLHRALRVVETKAPLVVPDVRRHAMDHHRPAPSSLDLVSYAGVPLTARDQVIGVLGVYTKELHNFSFDEIEFLATVAGQASIAIENAQLFEETERRRREAEELARIARSITETLDMTTVGKRVVASILELFHVKGASLRLRQADGSLHRFVAAGEIFSQTEQGAVMPTGIGLGGRALAQRRSIWSADALRDPQVPLNAAIRAHIAQTGNGSMIAVPLCVRENVIGMLTLVDRTGRCYSREEADLLQTFADQVALALQNARLYEQTERNLNRLQALREIEQAITSTLDLDSVLRLLLEKIDDLLPFSAATTIRLFNRADGRFHNIACRNIDEQEWKARIGNGSRSRSGEMLRTKRPVIVANMQDEPGVSAARFYREYGFVSYLGVPMIVQDEVMGILGFYTKESHDFSQDEIDLLLTVAGQAAIAINNARLYKDLALAKKELEITNRSLERSLQQLDSLYTTLAPLEPGATNKEIMDATIGRLIEATGADAALIRLWDTASQNYCLASQRGYPDAYLERVKVVPQGGANDWVVKHGELILAPDIVKETRFRSKPQLDHNFHSCVMLPLNSQDNVAGVIQLSSKRPGYFHEEHREQLLAIARQISIALENRRLFDDLKRSRDDLEKANVALTESNRALSALHAVATASSQSLNLEQTLHAAIEKMTEIFNFDATRIHLFDKERENLILRASFEQDPEHCPPTRTFRRGEGVVGAATQTGETLILSPVSRDSQYQALTRRKTTGHHSHQFLAVFPIKGKAASLGTMTCVGEAPRSLAAGEIQLLEAISDQLAVAIENSWLYQDVRSKVDELQLKTLELERANKVKDEFLGLVSHELRTPINVIMGYTSLLRDGVLGAINSRQQHASEKIAREANELLEMINTLLFTTTLESERVAIEIQEFTADSLLAELRANYAVTTPRQVTMKWDAPAELPKLNSDRRKLKQILDNLIGNAIKFTSQGAITVSVRARDRATHGANSATLDDCPLPLHPQAAILEFSVSDTGVGMPSEALARVFDKFYQADSSGTRSFGGVGLGLYIAKRFAKLLGGAIAVASTEGVGSTFTLTIPCDLTPGPRCDSAAIPYSTESGDA